MSEARLSPVFGKRKEPHTVIIARGDKIRHFKVRPWMAAIAGSVICTVSAGYILATSYLIFRDDLLSVAMTHQARLQEEYEARISALRAQVDHLTSRQLIDQQVMEDKVSELLRKQAQLAKRHGRIGPVLDRAAASLSGGEQIPVPSPRPEIRAGLDAGESGGNWEPDFVSAYAAVAPDRLPWPIREAPNPVTPDQTDKLFAELRHSLHSIEAEQIGRVNALTEEAYQVTESIAGALGSVGISLDSASGETGIGGPLVAPNESQLFDTRVRELDEALDRLDTLKAKASALPLRNPAPGTAVSSRFGLRRDPLLGTAAHHSGVDFRAPTGSPARATAPGTVVKAGWYGGYGRMVEVDHGNGITTRYGHLSRIMVKVGEKVATGTTLGRTGSSGRSTGPHLHYEIRRDGKAVNPLAFIKAGKRISQYL